MTSRLSFRKATVSDIPGIKKILDEAREAQRQQGFTQWEEGYPSTGVIAADIESGRGYLLEEGNEAAAYSAIGFSDREYERLENIWHHHGPYGVIHRTGIADRYRGRHVSAILFDFCEKVIRNNGAEAVRIDTGTNNRVMLHILSKRGYINHGVQYFIWGERIALEKIFT